MKKLYNASPVFLQNIACTLIGVREKRLRFGKKFDNYYKYLLKSQWYSKSDIEEYQTVKLKEIITYSYENIKYYKDLFDSILLKPSDIRSLSDMYKIPSLTKEIIRKQFKDLVNPNYNESIRKQHTSGSTGKALDFHFSVDAIKFRWALWFRHRERFGVKPNDPYATFTGHSTVPIKQKSPPYWRENYAMNQTVFTMHHISPWKVQSIVSKLNQGGFVYYSGYPSILFSLAAIIEDMKLEIVSPPKIIFTGAETLLEDQRSLISKVFKCDVTDLYGFSEGAGNASRCTKDLFHEDFEYGILECVNGDRNGIYTTGEIIGTGFTNLAMPFIRYKVGDRATWVEKECECGLKSKGISKIEGRYEDFIITPEGNKLLRFDYIFKNSSDIKETQVVQRRLGEIIIRIVKRPTYSKKSEILLQKEISDKVSPLLKVKFEYINEIEREATGKFRAVKSFLQ